MSNTFTVQSNTTIGVFSPWLHSQDPRQTPRWPRNHTIISDFSSDEDVKSTFEAPGTAAFGGVNALGSLLKFSISEADRALEMYLELTVGVPTGTPGTYIRLAPGAVMRMLGKVEYQYQQKQLYEANPREIFWHLLHEDIDKSVDRRAQLYLSQSPALRSTLALATQTFRIPVPSWFLNRFNEDKAPLLRALTERIELRVTLGSIGDILDTDYTAPALTIVGQPQLRLVRDAYTVQTRASLNQLAMTQRGIVALYKEWQTTQLSNNLPIGTTDSGWMRVTSLRRESPVFLIGLRPTSATTAYSGTQFDYDFADLDNCTIEIRTANGLFLQETPVRYHITRMFRRNFTSREFPVIPIVLADDLESPDQASGSLDFTFAVDMDIRLRWSVATVRALRVDLDAMVYNAMGQQGTQIQRIGN